MADVAPPPGWRPPIDLWWFLAMLLDTPPLTLAGCLLPAAATHGDVVALADRLSKRPISVVCGLDREGALALQRVVDLYRESKRRK